MGTRAALVALTLLATCPDAASGGETLAAALARGDSAWSQGRFADARAAYEAALAADSMSVRANYKLAVLAGRDNRLAAARALIRRARTVEPADPELARTEARLVAWSGQYREADSLYARAIALEPGSSDARLELARLRVWEGRRDEARAELGRALVLAPGSLDALTLQREMRADERPQVDVDLVLASDSDHNVSWSRTIATSLVLGPGVRGFLNGGSLSATDPTLAASRSLGEAGLALSRGGLELVAAAGARWLAPQDLGPRSVPCYRTTLSWRAAPAVVIGGGVAHYPLDETAVLIGRHIDPDEFQASLEAHLLQGTTLSAGGGYTNLSDGNHRASGVASLMRSFGPRVSAGVLSRVLAYDERGAGYFSPDRFGMAEGRANVAWAVKPWSGRVGAGLGVQQVGRGVATQSEWHGEGRLACRWAVTNQVELAAGASNSANTSTSGAYRYLSSALTLRIGF